MLVTLVMVAALLAVLGYIIPVILHAFVFQEADLKKQYGASWGLVTGASSGIGKAIAERLASQNINVVLVALDDALLKNTTAELQKKFPKLQFRAVGADLSGANGDYMQAIRDATNDIDVNLVFNNAGYITTGLFADLDVTRQLRNYEVNATSAIKITHHFVNDMLDKRLPGLVTFTSSSAGFIPCPMSVIYGATKAFLTEFAASLAAEIKGNGIDVVVVHPSPVDSNFYANAGKMSSLRLFQKTAAAPSGIAECIFKCAGRLVVCDQGYFSVLTKLMLKVLDWNLLTEITKYGISTSGDFRALKQDRPHKPTAAAAGKQ